MVARVLGVGLEAAAMVGRDWAVGAVLVKGASGWAAVGDGAAAAKAAAARWDLRRGSKHCAWVKCKWARLHVYVSPYL